MKSGKLRKHEVTSSENFQAFVVFPQWIQEFPQMNRILERKKVHFLKNFPENV